MNLLIITDIFPLSKEICRVLICTPFNLVLDMENVPKWLIVHWCLSLGCHFPDMASPLSLLFQTGGTGLWLLLSSFIQSQSLRVNIAKTHNPTKSISSCTLSGTCSAKATNLPCPLL